MRWDSWLLGLSLLLTGVISWQVLGIFATPAKNLCVLGCLDAVDACKVGGQVWCIEAFKAPGCLGPGKCYAPRCKEFYTSVSVSYQCQPATGPQFEQYKFKKWYDCDGDGKNDCGCYAAYICPKPKPGTNDNSLNLKT